MKLGVLISGRGSNLQALLAAKKEERLPLADFRLAVSNKPDAPGLDIARSFGLRTAVIDGSKYRGRRAEHDRAIDQVLREHECEAIVLAGYMRVLGAEFIAGWRNRIINIHPSLLPSFPGLHAQRQALEYGVRTSGCTVHFVDEGTDTGPIILQRTVPVLPGDTEDSLAARILVEEHHAIVEAVALLSQGRVNIEGRSVRVSSGGRVG